MNEMRTIARNGLWSQNPVLGQMLGLCSLLAVSTTMVNAVSLGIATILVMLMSNLIVSSLRSFIPFEIRIPIFILIIASMVTVVDMAMNAYLHELYLVLGIFIPLIVVNCIVLARVEAFAAKNAVGVSSFDGVMMGIGFVWVIGLLGAIREFVGQGTIFGGIDMVIPGLQAIQVLPEDYPGFLVAILPPGAFFILGLMVAGRNWMEDRANRQLLAQRLHDHDHATAPTVV